MKSDHVHIIFDIIIYKVTNNLFPLNDKKVEYDAAPKHWIFLSKTKDYIMFFFCPCIAETGYSNLFKITDLFRRAQQRELPTS